jgi:hypothetical protein
MPITEKQLEANRRNAQLSTGPQTAEGKKRCGQNAFRHGLTGQVAVMTEEDRAAFDSFSTRMLKSLVPEGEAELQLAARIAKDTWRINRVSAIEDNIFALSHEANSDATGTNHPQIDAAFGAARTFIQEAKQFQLLSLYEQRINRSLQKNIALFRQMQSDRIAQRANEMAEAELLLQVSVVNGLTYEPAKDGFVFSNAEIVASIDRNNRLKQAREFIRGPKPGTEKAILLALAA